MALSIQSNMASMSIQNQLGRSNNDLSTALERLGSGFKINSAKDDAAGLQIASRLNAQVRGQDAALYNSNNAMSMMQTAEGAFDEMTNIAYRMKELATQGANGTNGTDEYTAMKSEFVALEAELKSIMDNTSFGGTELLKTAAGKFDTGAVTFQVGSSTAETLGVNVSTAVQAINTTVNAAGAIGALTDAATSLAAITTVDTFIKNIGTARSSLGASMNRLDHTMNNVTNMKENTQAAASTLMDADFAAETSNMTKQQLLMNSGISVLSTANSTTQMIGSLLR
ncbi:Lateral flagellin [Pseudoalteromonas aliena]|uniref:Flagellin n=4 Tax=Pseudoalteromonas TaxID=53246 RepID=A0A1Q2GV38_9GAMM|nr:flagellin [Pseudoalteromonas aliena]AQP98972.1 Lateral flagellin [Pseudoalteromonas aliena]AQP98974.1 Lateral flagellin [Pseudoalteromonas aliena]AQQ01919.1 Lateral flagellin [Pseudoalteromonas aliena]AQQ01921.1 Lateral flagellin [Pseudoalteromonas aliena]